MNMLKSNGRALFIATVLAATCATAQAQSLTAEDKAAIQQLSASYMTALFPDPNGVSRLLTSGVRIMAKDNAVTGRVFLKAGGYDDEAYETTGPGQWRVKSSTHVAAAAH